MADSLFSPYWYRAASLHPRLVSSVSVRRQVFRGEQWYVLMSAAGARQFRVNALGYQLVGRLDGRASVQQIWDGLVRQLGTEAPSQTEVLSILSELAAAGMIQSEFSPDLGGIFDAVDRRRRNVNPLNPVALRVPLFNPGALLDALMPFAGRLFRPALLWLWAAAMCAGVLLAAMHWPELANHASVHGMTPRNLLLMWLLYPLIKLVHELAHACAIRHWRGEVTEIGAMLFLLIPIPYVDASAASGFPDKRQRMLVSAMGVIAETSIAFAALIVWLNVADGWVRDIAFASMLIGGLSTVLVNANPLMRYDGYYVLTDWLELPGLAGRADAWLKYLGERWLLGNASLTAPPGAIGQRALLTSYGLAAFAWRILLYGSALFWLLGKHLLLGLAFGLWLLWRYLAQPFWRITRLVLLSPRLEAHRGRALAGFSLVSAACLVLIAGVPMPSHTRVEGVVWVPEDAQLRNATEGFVEEVLAGDNTRVRAGQPVLRLSNRELQAEREQLATRRQSLFIAFNAALMEQPGLAVSLREELEKVDERLADFDARLDALLLRAPATGVLALPRAEDLPGRFLPRGTALAHVVVPGKVVVRAVLEQTEIEQLRDAPPRIEVRMAEQRDRSLPARLTQQAPAASFQLPSITLGDRGGGRMVTDPADQQGLRTLESFFVLDLIIDSEALQRIGSRAWVRFEHPAETLARQWSRRLHQIFVRQLGSAARDDSPFNR